MNPDLFLATRADRDVYRRALEVMASGVADPSRTPAELHAAIARQHPRLFQRHHELFEVEPQATGHRPPAALYRGLTCLGCLTRQARGADLVNGLCPSCTAATSPTTLASD